MPASQPIDVHPPLADTDLFGAWLSTTTRGVALGTDASPAGDDMTPVNKPTAERVGAHFTSGSFQYLRRAEADWRSGDSFGTISAWIKRDSIGSFHTIWGSCDEGDDTNKLLLWIGNTDVLWLQSESGGGGHNNIRGSTTINANEWYHVAAVSDGGTYGLYVNGQRETLNVSSGANNGHWLSDAANRDSITIGCRSKDGAQDYYFNGSIRDVRYRFTYMQETDILREFHEGVPDDTLAFWTVGGQTDLTRYELPITNNGGVITGHQMDFGGGPAESLQTTALVLTNGMTVSLWFNAAAIDTTVLFNNVEHLNRRLVIMTHPGGEMRAGYFQGAVYRAASGTGYEANRWHHVYVTWDADETCRMWLDMTELTGSVDPSSGNALTLRLGSSTGGTSEFTGQMRDCRVWQADKGEAFGQTLYEAQRKYY